jgi:hypothetical protein
MVREFLFKIKGFLPYLSGLMLYLSWSCLKWKSLVFAAALLHHGDIMMAEPDGHLNSFVGQF